MKILLSAFAFAPNQGSEAGVGWRWAMELAKHHDVIVVTDITRRELVEAAVVTLPRNVRVKYFRPNWLSRVPLNAITAQLLYAVWQFALPRFARRLHREYGFDVAIHSTYGVFRHPSFLGSLNIPFIFGPLGGGEDAPMALKRSIHGREKFKELLRLVINKVALFDPFLWRAYSNSTLILVKTEDTRNSLPWPFRNRAIVYPEIGIDVMPEIQSSVRSPGKPLSVLFAGRLLGWKGAHLAIRAVARAIDQGVPIEFTVLGQGPFENELRKLAKDLGLHNQINWINRLPQGELFSLYREMHCFLFPSLHDSSGNVVLEAQANGLPVICLDLGGPATLVTPESAIVVGTRGLDEESVVDQLVDAIIKLANDEAMRQSMSNAAISHVRNNMSWEKRVYGVFDLLKAQGVAGFEDENSKSDQSPASSGR